MTRMCVVRGTGTEHEIYTSQYLELSLTAVAIDKFACFPSMTVNVPEKLTVVWISHRILRSAPVSTFLSLLMCST